MSLRLTVRQEADMRNRYVSHSQHASQKESVNKRIIIGVILTVPVVLMLAIMQTSVIKIFGKPPGLTLLFTCAMGMLLGEREGAATGVFAGFILDCLGGGVFSISPIFFMLCGYFCGICARFVLSRNMPSFVVYSLVVGVLKELIVVFYFGMSSQSLNLFEVLTNTLIPDYFAFVLCSPVIFAITYILKKVIFYKRINTRKI